MTKVTTQAEGCTLEVGAVKEGADKLRLSYAFSNNTSRNAYLFNRLFSHVAANTIFQTKTDLVYISVEKDKDQVTIAKRLVPVPPLMKVEIRDLPCVTKVPAGGRFEEKLLVPLPLKPHSPYETPNAEDLQSSPKARELWFELGFFVAPPEGDKLVKHVQTADGPGLRFNPFPITSQKVLRAGPLPQVPSLAVK